MISEWCYHLCVYDDFDYFRVTLTFLLADGSKRTAQAKIGDNLLDVIVENDLDVDGFGKYLIINSKSLTTKVKYMRHIKYILCMLS
jgi:hypothetical protein